MRTKDAAVLADVTALATVAVKDLDRAKHFYEKTLGLELADRQEPGSLSYQTGGGALFVYESNYAGTNKATAVTWLVGDVEAVVRGLNEKGVSFEHYDLPGMTRQGDVHVAESMKAAWFKDPDGNIHALVSG
jgi:catechol 2,3-dioxygenase-like lactoylglutathione lyase family enzyme